MGTNKIYRVLTSVNEGCLMIIILPVALIYYLLTGRRNRFTWKKKG